MDVRNFPKFDGLYISLLNHFFLWVIDNDPAKPLVISKFGSSGDFPGCTDLAYTKAIQDGVEVLDCPVQFSSDGIPFCSSSINLKDSTNADQSPFKNRVKSVSINNVTETGIYAHSLTWKEIQTLKRKFKLFSTQAAQNYLRFLMSHLFFLLQ